MRVLFLGMSVATVIGLSAGGAMKPVLEDFVGGPQTQLAAAARRAAPAWREAGSWTSYNGDIPDYVIGTDWISANAAMAAAEPTPAPPEPEPQREPPEPFAQHVALEEAPPPPPRYPSAAGDILAGMESYAPPTPPDDKPPIPPPID